MVEPAEGAAVAAAGIENPSPHSAIAAQMEQEAVATAQVQDGARFRLTLSEVGALEAKNSAAEAARQWPTLDKLATYDTEHSSAVSETLSRFFNGDFMQPIEDAKLESARLMESALTAAGDDPAARREAVMRAETEAQWLQFESYLSSHAEVVAAQSQLNVRLGINSMLKETVTMAVKAFNKVTSGR